MENVRVPESRLAAIRSFRRDGLLCVGVGLGALLVYVLGACRTIYVGDSGELVAAAYTLGIPHPSGYPLYVLTGKLWSLAVPIGSIAFRLSLLSAVCAAVTVALVCRLLRRWGIQPVAAVGAVSFLAFAPSFWSQANIQRVYALNALFVVLATSAAFAWYRDRRGFHLGLGFFMCGLGASNHTFMGVYAAALAGFVLLAEPALLRRFRTLLLVPGCFALGLLPYLYLPLMSRADPRLDWGNPETLPGFLDVVLRRSFWDRAWLESPADLLAVAADYFRSLGSELLGVGAALAVLGVVVGRRRRWPVALPLFVMAANLVILALHGSRSDIFIWHRYYIPSYLMASLLAAAGLDALFERVPRGLRWLPAAIPLTAILLGWRDNDRSRYRIAEDFSRALFDTLPPGAHLSATDDNILFVLTYLHLVEGFRPDVDLILQGVEQEHPSLRFRPDRDRLFFTHHPNWNVPELRVVPVGLTFRVVDAGSPLPEPVVPKWNLDGEKDPGVPKDYLTRNLIGHFHFMLGVTFETRDWRLASREFEEAKAAAPRDDVLFYNLGLIYRRNGLDERALEAFEHSHAVNPRTIAGKDRARASDRIGETNAELERLQAIEGSLTAELERRGVAFGTAAFHMEMAALLEARGEGRRAHGHRLRALESEAPR